MNLIQQKRYEKMRENAFKAYDAWNNNMDKSKDKKLHEKWLEEIEKLERFEYKYF